MLKYIFGYLWESAAAHTKWVFLALAIKSGLVSFYVLTLAMFFIVLPSCLQVVHLITGVRSLKVLADRMHDSSPTPWIKVKPYSKDELIRKFTLIQFNVPLKRDGNLFLIKKEGAAEMNHYCYINLMSNSYIETVNADVDIDTLPAAQKFMIYHELAHASFLGGEHWTTLRSEFFYIPMTLGLLIVFLSPDMSALLFAPVAILAFFAGSHARRHYRNVASEQAADRMALRWIVQESPEEAIKIGQMKIRRWDAILEKNRKMGWTDTNLILERRKSVEKFVRTIQDWRDGKMTVDPDRVPWPLVLPFHFLLAVTSLILIVLWGNAPTREQTAALSWLMGVGFLLLMLVGARYKVEMIRLESYIQSRLRD